MRKYEIRVTITDPNDLMTEGESAEIIHEALTKVEEQNGFDKLGPLFHHTIEETKEVKFDPPWTWQPGQDDFNEEVYRLKLNGQTTAEFYPNPNVGNGKITPDFMGQLVEDLNKREEAKWHEDQI